MRIFFFKKLNSTNIKAKSYPSNSVIVADEQTLGKGRFRRKWSSAKGGLYFSIVLEPKSSLMQHYTFIASLAVLKAIKNQFNIKTGIKWPNDILYNKKKLCGILSEGIFSEHKKLIVGIGVNTNNKIPKNLKAVSLKTITNKTITNKKLLRKILFYFQKYIIKYNENGFKPILNEWKKHCVHLNKEIKVKTIKKIIKGKNIDVDKEGILILKKNGKIVKIVEADIASS